MSIEPYAVGMLLCCVNGGSILRQAGFGGSNGSISKQTGFWRSNGRSMILKPAGFVVGMRRHLAAICRPAEGQHAVAGAGAPRYVGNA